MAGCAVGVDAPRVDARTRSACLSFTKSLPPRVSDQSRRTVDDAQLGAAWGSPAIVLRCGVGQAKGFTRFSTCQTTNGIDWFVPEGQFGDRPVDVVMTTIGRSPRVEVRVPAAYWPPTAVMVDLTSALKAHTRGTGGCI
ncbi:MAG: DUF3515 domain-containing protein [Actinomycetota bacterium]|nr:DUF3515 domain-containing protein [Actinomycetota bacterium]